MENKNRQNNQNAEYGELVQFLAKKFDRVEVEIKEVKDGLNEVKNILDTKADKADVERVLTRVVMLGDKINDNRAEQLATKRQVAAHEKWIAKASNKIGVK